MTRPAQLVALASLPLALSLSACAEHATAPSSSALPAASGPIVARVGSTVISASAVASIASERGIAPREALELAVTEALFAQAAIDHGLAERPSVRAAVTATLARATLEQSRRVAAREPITPAELRVATDKRWLDLDRAESFRTVHSVVLASDRSDAPRASAARALRDELLRAMSDVASRAKTTSPPARAGKPWDAALAPDAAVEDFLRAAKPFESRGLKVVSQELPPVTPEGWSVAVDSRRFDLEFATCVAKLTARGELGSCESAFGYHVVLLLERIPEQRVPEAQRLARLRDSILGERANQSLTPALAARASAELPSNVDALLALVTADR